jgi:quercetin dioxygenase-like cupin family protein
MNSENKGFDKAVIMNFPGMVEYSENGIISKRVLDKKTGNVTLFSFDTGQRLSEHTAPFDAMVQCIDGEVEVLIDRKPYLLKAGESIIMPANIPHAVNAISRFKMLLTMIKEV